MSILVIFQLRCTPLHEAVRNGHTVVAWMLIEKHANVNAEAMVRGTFGFLS